MEKLTAVTKQIMDARFGKDNVISLATSDDNVPYVRYVNAYYEEGAFYVITYALSNKMRQIEKNSTVALAGDWFTATGKDVSLGRLGNDKNSR